MDFVRKCGKKIHVAEMKEKTGEASDSPSRLFASLQRVLRPIVRLLISRSMTFPLAANVLREVYVDVAVDEFPVSGKPQSDSRITLLTGVHRKDVKRLRQRHEHALRPPRAASLGSQLIARWTSLPEYLDESGAPRPLPRLASSNEKHSFESLVRSVNTDLRPRVVLDEWLRRGIAQIDDQDHVCLTVRAFIPPGGSDEMTYYFGRNLHDHIAAAVHNMLGEEPPLLERSVNYNNLSPAAIAELRELAQRRGMEALQEINARALHLQQAQSGQPEASHRFNFGIYVFSEDQAAPSGDDAHHAPAREEDAEK
jgi:hypothetical protein